MLAGLAPLHAERLRSRGGPCRPQPDPLVFYETSSYGPAAVRVLEDLVGAQQLLYGSDRPVVDPVELGMPDGVEWESIAESTHRALGARRGGARMSATSPHAVTCHRRPARPRSPRPPRSTRARSSPSRARAVAICLASSSGVRHRAGRPSGAVDPSGQARHHAARVRGAAQRRARDRVADLLDGRARHRLPRPRRLVRGCGGRQRRCARGAPGDRRPDAQRRVQGGRQLPLLRLGYPSRQPRRGRTPR